MAKELGCEVVWRQALDSTQDHARALAAGGGGPAVVVADEQLRGRGTRDRTWHAPAGRALLASWILRPAPAEPALTGVLASVALARALERCGIRGATVKWPNDVELGGRKVAGILAHGSAEWLVLGIGVNVHQTAAEFPPELRSRAVSLAQAGGGVDRLDLLVRLAAEIGLLADEGGRRDALAEWRERSPMLGRAVQVRRPGEPPLAGVAAALQDDGALLVETAYGPQRIVAGEVVAE